MIFTQENLDQYLTSVEKSSFSAEGSDVVEQMYMIHALNGKAPFIEQLQAVVSTYKHITESDSSSKPMFIRVFLSDTANQSELVLDAVDAPCALSIIEQAPLDGSKIAMLVYCQSNIEVEASEDGIYTVSHGAYKHLWACNYADPELSDSKQQTYKLLTDYVAKLSARGCTLFDDTIRTWFYIQNVDVNYHGMVVGRNDAFDQEGLVSDTHFITSTGIQGRVADHRILSIMDTYSIKGLQKGQIQFLYAPTHLNSTYEYGVRFERGTAVHYGDRTHVFISGTASIDNKGDVVHVGDIQKQTLRMWENVETLLAEADSSFDDLAHLIIYLRDISDVELVREMFDAKFANVPKVFVLAPVCRPTWLIEMECIAIRKNNQKEFAKY